MHFIKGTRGLVRVISDSPALRLFIYSPMSDPHPSTHHPKSASCHLKVKGINSPPLHWGSASIHSSLKNLFFALWLPLSRMPMRGSDEWATPTGIVLSCWDFVCWIMSCVLGVHMAQRSREGNFWYITGFSTISSLNNFLIPIVHSLYNAVWVFCKAILCQFFFACLQKFPFVFLCHTLSAIGAYLFLHLMPVWIFH